MVINFDIHFSPELKKFEFRKQETTVFESKIVERVIGNTSLKRERNNFCCKSRIERKQYRPAHKEEISDKYQPSQNTVFQEFTAQEKKYNRVR